MADSPRYVTALISALRLRNAEPERLQALDDSEWEQLLIFGDRMHLTIPLVQTCGDFCPRWVRLRADRNIEDNARRFQLIKNTYAELADALREAHVDYLVLKGFTKSPDYAPNPRHRIQSDIDIFCPRDLIFRARDALYSIGYRSQHKFDDQPWDHLPPLRKKSEWRWRGNAYDPEMPLAVELHHCFWDRAAVRCGPEGDILFWQRRIGRRLEEISFPALHPIDNLGYCALNLVRDLLRVGIVTSQVYELAWFLHRNSRNDEFWNGWVQVHDEEVRRLESVSFLLARTWFHCDLSETAQAEIRRLPVSTRRWFEIEATSPSPMGWMRPNKDAIWLHSSLMRSAAEKRRIVFGRLLPRRVLPVDTAIANRVANSSPNEEKGWHNYSQYFVYLFARVGYHLKILPTTLWHGFCWWRAARPSKHALPQSSAARNTHCSEVTKK
jgi:hypothetical protein